MKLSATLPIGTRIVATTDAGPVIRGQIGVVTGLGEPHRFLWWRTTYGCTFLGNIQITMRRSAVARQDHGCSIEVLEDPLWFLHTRDDPDATPMHHGEVRPPSSHLE